MAGVALASNRKGGGKSVIGIITDTQRATSASHLKNGQTVIVGRYFREEVFSWPKCVI